MTSPLYATGVGLVMRGFHHLERSRPRQHDRTDVRQGTEKPGQNTKGVLDSFWKKIVNGASDVLSGDDDVN
jgi:hypothetical protein